MAELVRGGWCALSRRAAARAAGHDALVDRAAGFELAASLTAAGFRYRSSGFPICGSGLIAGPVRFNGPVVTDDDGDRLCLALCRLVRRLGP